MRDDVELSLSQIREAWRLMCAPAPGPAIEDRGGIFYAFSGLPIPFFNIAVINGRNLSGETLRSRAEAALAWAVDKQVPWFLLVTHERLLSGVDATAVLEDCGLAPAMPVTGMLAQRVAPAGQQPAGLQLRVPQDDAGCAALLDVNSLAYAMPLDEAKPVLGRRGFWQDHFPVLGTAGDTPACCATVLMVDGHRYVAMVATDPTQQRRGYADAAMRHALEAAAEVHGELPTVLHATDAGRPVYERMGYAAISSHMFFIDKTFLPGHQA
jgi:GNAT superfamily N-acetyltransferase